MNKTTIIHLSILGSFLCALSSFAGPKVGDISVMEGSVGRFGQKSLITTTQKITAFDANRGVYTLEQSQVIETQSRVHEIQVTEAQMMTEERAAEVVANCGQGSGKREIVIVRAGTFQTCRANTGDGSTLWIAPVPFGVVKLQTKVPTGTLNLSLSSFSRGP